MPAAAIAPEFVVFHLIQHMGCPSEREILSRMRRMGLTHDNQVVKRSIVNAIRNNGIERAGGDTYIITNAALDELKPEERAAYTRQLAKNVAEKDKLAERRQRVAVARAKRKEAIQQEEKAFVAAFERGEALVHGGAM